MELKKWVDYSLIEKENLLGHLFNYYGKSLFNLKELEMYTYLSGMIPDTLFKIFLRSHLNGLNGQTLILEVLREEKGVQSTLLKEKANDYDTKDIEEYEGEFLAEVVKTFNNPQPAIPLSNEEIDQQLAKMFGN